MTIEEFCKQHRVCSKGRKWALANCQTMDDVWQTAPWEYLLWVATRPGVLSDRELRLFACWCVRQVWHLLEDERSRHAVEVAERYANGRATDAELEASRLAAHAAASAAWSAATEAAWYAAMGAVMLNATPEVQCQYLRERFRPFREKAGKNMDYLPNEDLPFTHY